MNIMEKEILLESGAMIIGKLLKFEDNPIMNTVLNEVLESKRNILKANSEELYEIKQVFKFANEMIEVYE